MIDPVLFAELFAPLTEQLSGRRLSDAAVTMWYEFLSSKLNDEQFERQVKRLFYESTKLPTPREFVEAAIAATPEVWTEDRSVRAYADLTSDAEREAYRRDLERSRQQAFGVIDRLKLLAAKNRQLRTPGMAAIALQWAESQPWVEIQWEGDKAVNLQFKQVGGRADAA